LTPLDLILITAVFYFLPAVVALIRSHHQRFAIILLNVLLGWTLLGWIAALVWSAPQNNKRGALNYRNRHLNGWRFSFWGVNNDT